ncbi:APC family permease [Jatrophihabitans endophyticus]|uniref:APC family permease n=1 Tax=Jatrophihabitans endophyticus TaxID=1206085 RepID=UPI001A03F9FA|nr:amino acid permease [Jatrophihabitans endophyticus]MBE7189221.1 amino acid permease [Jatrophihabitans endophyticus]
MKNASTAPSELELPETLTYRVKRVLLGRPLVTAALHEEKLSKKTALGVLSSDCISSSAYGSEEMLIMLLPVFGLTGFGLLMPLTGVVLALLVLTTLSYREVVKIYTKAGGSYVVARENFGPKVAQIASVALLIDYIVTVAVQTAAGTAAITSLIPSLSPYALEISLAVVGVLAYGNLRGVREAGKAFAFPTYFFVASAGLVVLVGVAREVFGDLPTIAYSAHQRHELIGVHDTHHALLAFGAIYVLMKAFANGGASLTGLEAISNGVSAFKPDAGTNARRTLTVMSGILGTLVLGVSFLAWQTHATPFASGSPTVISQVAHAVFGHGWYGNVGFVVVQVATALILYTGANTPFTGFPFLASFIAEDSFLPRQLTRRGHRLAFSTGILVLTTFTVALLLGVGAHVDKLLPFYAIGVFTGFTMAGLGMARYHRTHRTKGWRRRAFVNAASGVVSAGVVLIFAVVKFAEGAWLVVLLFPIGWAVLMRLNQRYRAEARSLDLATFVRPDGKRQEAAPHYGRHNIFVLVDRLDLAVLRALRYAGSLRPSELRVVHVALDDVEAARLQKEWIERGLCDRYPLQIVDCPDRRLVRVITELAWTSVVTDHAEVTLLLPRRSFRTLSQRLLHDRTADRIAEAVARIPHVAATIVPFDTTLAPGAADRLELRRAEAAREPALELRADDRAPLSGSRSDGSTPIAAVRWRQKVTVRGRVKSVVLGTTAGRALEVEIHDDTAGLRLLFMGRTSIAGITVGSEISATGRVGEYSGHLAIANPSYQLLVPA